MRAVRRGCALAAMMVGLGACDGVLGIYQLPPDDGGSIAPAPLVDSSIPDTGGQDSGPVCSGTASVSSGSNNPACAPCLAASCCTELQACAGDAACVAERTCSSGCGGDGTCKAACRNASACGLAHDLGLDDCTTASCAAECAALTDAGVTADAGEAESGVCVPVAGPCSPYPPQCGCSAGQTCVFPSVGGTTACIAPGAASANQACTQDSDCVQGTSCVTGACKPFCSADQTCPSTSSGCRLALREVTACNAEEPIFGDTYCATQCDPVDPQAACGPGVTCNVFGTGATATTDCVGPTGSGTGPGGCGGASYCAPGYSCTQYTFTEGSSKVSLSTCDHWCRVGFSDCTGSEACTSLTPPVELGGVTYGACTANCALYDRTSCPTGSTCSAINGPTTAGNYTDCVPSAGTGVGAGACAKDGFLDCAPGRACVTVSGDGASCFPWCRMGSTDCAAGTTCMTFTGAPTIAGVTYGFCN